jgi:hypothetical protein
MEQPVNVGLRLSQTAQLDPHGIAVVEAGDPITQEHTHIGSARSNSCMTTAICWPMDC